MYLFHTVFGIDADTKRVACAVLRTDKDFTAQTVSIETLQREGNVAYCVELEDLIRHAHGTGGVVYLEDTFCINRKGYKALCAVQGEIFYEARRNSFSNIDTVQPSEWQSWLFSITKALQPHFEKEKGKAWVASALELSYPKLFTIANPKNEHEIDALALALYGRYLVLSNAVPC